MQRDAALLYRNNEILNASPAELVAMLYTRAIQALKETQRCMAAGDIQGRWKHNNQAIEIISHLWNTLDVDRGGDVAKNLSELYRFMVQRLGDVDSRQDQKAAADVIGLLEPLARSWRQLAAQAGQRAVQRVAPRGTGTTGAGTALSA